VSFTDLLVILLVGAAAAFGAARGLAVQILSFAGLALGAFVGSRIAPHLVAGGSGSAWVPVAGLVGAVIGAFALQTGAVALGRPLFRAVAIGPARALDMAGGALFGAALGLGLAWLFAVVALQQPSLGLRKDVQRSEILPRLVEAVPPDTLLNALGRFDPLPLLGDLPGTQLPPPDPSVRQSAGARAAQASVVKIVGTSCGLGVSGSGWVAAPDVVATNIHVVTGQEDTRVLTRSGADLDATLVYTDPRNDVALLRVPGLEEEPLAPAPERDDPRSVALLGYPGNGPLVAAPGSAGPTRRILGRNAYGEGPILREVVPLRGSVRRGDSGGPAVDARGRVVAMMFAATRGKRGGFGVPVELVEAAAGGRLGPVAAGPCAG
jgi:S1-C subfamily serine protease